MKKRPGAIRADVRLFQLSPRQAPAMFRWISDITVASNIGLIRTPSLANTKSWIRKANSNSEMWARGIMLNADYVGNVVLDLINTRTGLCRFSLYVGEPAARGKGVGLAASTLALRHAFHSIRLQKVYLTVHPKNLAAIRLYDALGFRLEGILRREFQFPDGTRLDAWRMGLLANDFKHQ